VPILNYFKSILSFASCALDMNFVRPKILNSYQNSHQGYHIKNGRHPLQQLIIDDGFIPNDTILGSDKYINIVTGPNFSGKSCYTRQVRIKPMFNWIIQTIKIEHYSSFKILPGWCVSLFSTYRIFSSL